MPRIALEKFPEQVKGSDSADSTLMRCALLAFNRVGAILHGLPQAPQPPPGALPEGVFSGQERLFEELEKSDREQRPSGPLAELLGLLTPEALPISVPRYYSFFSLVVELYENAFGKQGIKGRAAGA